MNTTRPTKPGVYRVRGSYVMGGADRGWTPWQVMEVRRHADSGELVYAIVGSMDMFTDKLSRFRGAMETQWQHLFVEPEYDAFETFWAPREAKLKKLKKPKAFYIPLDDSEIATYKAVAKEAWDAKVWYSEVVSFTISTIRGELGLSQLLEHRLGSGNVETFKGLIDSMLNTGRGGGVLQGGIVSIGTVTTNIDITAGCAVFVTPGTHFHQREITLVEWTAETALAVTNVVAEDLSYIGIDSSGNWVQALEAAPIALTDTVCPLAILEHLSTVVTLATKRTVVARDPGKDLQLLLSDIGTYIVPGGGEVYQGATAAIGISAGTVRGPGVGYDGTVASLSSANEVPIVASADISVIVRYAGSGGVWTDVAAATGIDNAALHEYQNAAATKTALTGTETAIHPLYLDPATGEYIAYLGHHLFTTRALAVTGLATNDNTRPTTYTKDPRIEDYVLLGYLIVEDGAAGWAASSATADKATWAGVGLFGSNRGSLRSSE